MFIIINRKTGQIFLNESDRLSYKTAVNLVLDFGNNNSDQQKTLLLTKEMVDSYFSNLECKNKYFEHPYNIYLRYINKQYISNQHKCTKGEDVNDNV